MAYVKVWIHAVWGTKNRVPILSKEVRPLLFQHMKKNAVDKSVYMDFVNGYTDHVHCMFALNADITIAKTLQLIKGESSFWANDRKLIEPKLEWADEYFAVSVSESKIDTVRHYIKNQEEHHQKITFQQEYDMFINRYNFNGQV